MSNLGVLKDLVSFFSGSFCSVSFRLDSIRLGEWIQLIVQFTVEIGHIVVGRLETA